jgi:hypothetical protein
MPGNKPIFLITLLVLGIAVRVWFYTETCLTFEDSLITFRYAENLAEGRGFVYNVDEKVLGTTSPLWTLILASVKKVGFQDTVKNSRILAVLLDMMTLLLLVTAFRAIKENRFTLIWATLFVTSSGIVPISMSGMETPLLLFSMALTIRGLIIRSPIFSIGLVLTVLTRIDGILFASIFLAAALSKERRWAFRQAALALVLIAPWLTFSTLYFGDILPQSMKAKMVVYDLGISASAGPFLERFTPFGNVGTLEFFLKALSSIVLLVGLVRAIRRNYPLLPIGVFFIIYCAFFMGSGGLIFPWYLTPPTFAHDMILALGLSVLLARIEKLSRKKFVDAITVLALCAIASLNIITIHSRTDEYREIQEFEEELRVEIGSWLKDHVGPGESVFLEPVGYIGYFAGPDVRIIDEVGIISPPITHIRRKGPGWYIKAIRKLKPDYIVQYTRSLRENIAEGGNSKLFVSSKEIKWFYGHYSIVGMFDVSGRYPHIYEKEKGYTILRMRDNE